MNLFHVKQTIYLLLCALCIVTVAACQDHHFVPYEEIGPLPEPGSPEAIANSKPRPKRSAPTSRPDFGPGDFKGEVVAGSVALSPNIKEAVSPDWTLYIIVRSAKGGPPLAAVRFSKVTFPIKFRLDEKNVMIGEPKPGMKLLVEARYDSDGDPITKDDVDLYGVAKGDTTLGDKNVVITLDRKSD